jgi:Type I phosphodiesterase / nucleotide pyrophosphatase
VPTGVGYARHDVVTIRISVGLAAVLLASQVTVACSSSTGNTLHSRQASAAAQVTSSGEHPATSPPTAATHPAKGRVRPLLIDISVDGLNPAAIRSLGGSVPQFQQLAAQGASTLNARTAVELTDTLPNHTGMMTGRPVSGAHGHHVTFNEDDGRSLEAVNGHYVAGIFDVAHDHGRSTALYASKDKFLVLVRSWDARRGAVDDVGHDDGRNKLDVSMIGSTPRLVHVLLHRLRTQPDDLTFLHLAEPDLVGHSEGFMSQPYLDAVAATDHAIGRVLHAIASDPALRRRTTVVVTADHGGTGPNHRNPREPANYTIPFYAWGRGVAKDADLYALNPDRVDPGRSRPGYAGAQPIRNLDLAALSLDILGLPQLPGLGAGRTETLRLNRAG